MANTVALEKILDLQITEKQKAYQLYQKSIDDFEHIATKLYHLLKKKEQIESAYEASLQDTIPIEKIRSQMAYMEKLSKQIMELQHRVQEARSNMEKNQSILTDAHIEVKKYEKAIEIRKQKEKEQEKLIESRTMDEISLQQFVNQNR